MLDSGGFNLFEDDVFRRRVLGDRSNKNVQARQVLTPALKFNRNICICPVGEAPGVGQGPNASDFESNLIRGIGDSSSVVKPANNIVEGQPVLCNGEIRQFRSFVYADLNVDSATLSNETISELEKIFEETYNVLSYER